MNGTDIQPKDTRTRAKGIFLAVVAVVVAGIIINFAYSRFGGQKKVEVPEDLILGEEIDSSNVRLDFPDLSKVDLVQYKSDSSLEELKSHYLEILAQDGWTIVDDKDVKNIHLIIAQKGNNREVIQIDLVATDNGADVNVLYKIK